MQTESAAALRRLIDGTNDAVTALKNFELPVNHWDALLVFMTACLLDKSTHKAWELEISNFEACPTLSQLTAFVNSRIQALELVQTLTSKPV